MAGARAEAKGAKDTAHRVTVPKAPAPVKPTHQAAIAHDYSGVPIPAWLRQHRAWWKRHTPPRILDILDNGLLYQVRLPHCVSRAPPLCPYDRASLEYFHARKLIYEYEKIGAVWQCARSDVDYFFPWFVVLKVESTALGAKIKGRFISNLRKPDAGIPISHFRMDHWGHVFPALRKGQRGAKVDLKHAYFHIPLNERFVRYTGFSFDDMIFRFEAMPFGVNVAPQAFTDL